MPRLLHLLLLALVAEIFCGTQIFISNVAATTTQQGALTPSSSTMSPDPGASASPGLTPGSSASMPGMTGLPAQDPASMAGDPGGPGAGPSGGSAGGGGPYGGSGAVVGGGGGDPLTAAPGGLPPGTDPMMAGSAAGMPTAAGVGGANYPGSTGSSPTDPGFGGTAPGGAPSGSGASGPDPGQMAGFGAAPPASPSLTGSGTASTPQSAAEATAPASPGSTSVSINRSPPQPPGKRKPISKVSCDACNQEFQNMQRICHQDSQVDCGRTSCAARSTLISDSLICPMAPTPFSGDIVTSNCSRLHGLIKGLSPHNVRGVIDGEELVERFKQAQHVCEKIKIIEKFCKQPIKPVTTTKTTVVKQLTQTETTKTIPPHDCIGKESTLVCKDWLQFCK